MSQFFILSQLSSATASDRAAMSAADLSAMQSHELNAITGTYMTLGFVLLVIMVVMLLVRMPEGSDNSHDSVLDSFKRLIKNKKYVFGVVAQFFYVGAQICVWSFTIRIVMQELGLLEADAATIYLFSIIGDVGQRLSAHHLRHNLSNVVRFCAENQRVDQFRKIGLPW